MSAGDQHEPAPSTAAAAANDPDVVADAKDEDSTGTASEATSAPDEDSGDARASSDEAAGDAPVESGSEDTSEDHSEKVVASKGVVEEEEDDTPPMDWYILKVQSNRENSICDGLRRRVAVAGLDEFFGEVLVPTEDVAEYKNGKRRVVKRKLYPGYIVAHMVINDETWFLVRETPGIGDFTGAAGKPTPMLPHEVDRIVKSSRPDKVTEETIKTAIPFKVGDRVRIKEGTFENFEGDVDGIDEANGRVTVMINIFGRSTPVELEHWQIEAV